MQFGQSLGHLRLELLCDVGRKDDLARSGVGAHVDGFGTKSMVSRCELDEIIIAVEAADCNLRQEVSTNKESARFVTGLLFKFSQVFRVTVSPHQKRPSCKKNVSALRLPNQLPETPQSLDHSRPKHNHRHCVTARRALQNSISSKRPRTEAI